MFNKSFCLAISIFIYFQCVTSASFAAQFFQDSFESGDLTHTENGAYWYTGSQGPPKVVGAENGVTPKTGSKMLRFRFQPTQSPSTWMEERFNLGANKTNVYIGYDVWIPSNYSQSQSGGYNNKAIRIWNDNDASYGSAMQMGASLFSYPGNGDSQIIPEMMSVYQSNWVGSCSGSMSELQPNLINPRYFLVDNNSKGHWRRWEWHFKPDRGGGNGAIEFWVDGIKQFGSTTLSFAGAPCSPGYLTVGYLFGAANSVFTQVTDIYVDNVIFSDNYIGPIGSSSTVNPVTLHNPVSVTNP
jgi:hypothetical protein